MAHSLRELRERKNWSQEEAAQAMSVSRSHYVKLERGERGLTANTIASAAKAFGVSKSEVLGEAEPFLESIKPGQRQAPPTDGEQTVVAAARNRLNPIPVIGMAEAGSFREVDDISDLEMEAEYIFDEPDPDFPRAKMVAFEVRGDSMNAAVPPLLDGYRLICVDFEDAAVPVSDGMTVVVQRSRDGGLTREWSVKEVEMGEETISFCPRSTNPRHKPIVVPLDPEPDDAVEVVILAIARRVSAPIPRYRISGKRPA